MADYYRERCSYCRNLLFAEIVTVSVTPPKGAKDLNVTRTGARSYCRSCGLKGEGVYHIHACRGTKIDGIKYEAICVVTYYPELTGHKIIETNQTEYLYMTTCV